MPDAIQRPEPKAWRVHFPGVEGKVRVRHALYDIEPSSLTYRCADVTPLYTRADVIAWAKAVIEDTLVACECGQSGCYVCAGDSAVCQALNTLDDAAREWEAEND